MLIIHYLQNLFRKDSKIENTKYIGYDKKIENVTQELILFNFNKPLVTLYF